MKGGEGRNFPRLGPASRFLSALKIEGQLFWMCVTARPDPIYFHLLSSLPNCPQFADPNLYNHNLYKTTERNLI